MIRYKTIFVSGSDQQNLANALAGLGERDRIIHGFWFSQGATSAGLQYFFKGVAFLEQDQIVEFQLDTNLEGDGDANPVLRVSAEPFVEINLEIKAGQGLQVGFFRSGGTPSGNVIMKYEDK